MSHDRFDTSRRDDLIVQKLQAPAGQHGLLIDRVFNRAVRDERSPFWCLRHPSAGAWSQGYARVYIGNVQVFAHRVAYIAARGRPAGGLTIDHMCGVRDCVDPNHLEAVSVAENTRRGGAWRTHCKRGHEYTDENTYLWSVDGTRRCRTCDRERYMQKRDLILAAQKAARRAGRAS